jgi:hypothetical protein
MEEIMPLKKLERREQKVILLVNEREIEIPTDDIKLIEFNKLLLNPENFKKFTKDPMEYAASYGIKIDKDLSADLSAVFDGFDSIEEARKTIEELNSREMATFVAVAKGYLAVVDTKIALAF